MKAKKTIDFIKTPSHLAGFACLGGNDVISELVSDHHPVVHDGLFFWNIMMQCKTRKNGVDFNNGFGIIESNRQYQKRLKKVAQVIAEAVYRDPSIEAICICEGPKESMDIDFFFESLMRFTIMDRFRMTDMFNKPTVKKENWGLLMLADFRFAVTKVYDPIEDHLDLADRFQLWKLEKPNASKFVALAHFPFAGDEYKTEKEKLSSLGKEFCVLINKLMESYHNESLIFCADFNFNPYLISQGQDRALDKISHHNSVLLTPERVVQKTVTVDGVLLSRIEKQKYYSVRPEPDLLGKLKSEYRFFQSHLKRAFTDLMQREHDKQFGLILYQP
ncbi:MAG: hypothetical protein H0T84_13475 [Tatlockia sp.]|nr:hypothetical protein [Tatlockia sp.]